MKKTAEKDLLKIMKRLHMQGVEIEEMEQLAFAMESTKVPVHKKAMQFLLRNWNRIRGEVQESKTLVTLLNRARKEGKESLSLDERVFVQQQLKDFFRIFPASIIASANAILPIPGTSFITPMILQKLNLLPSKWREAHMLTALQKAHKKLQEQGREKEIKILIELETELNEQAKEREECDLLLVWDTNKNGIWDEEELLYYQRELTKTQNLYLSSKEERAWFVLHEGLVFGPTHLIGISEDLDVLICYQSKTQWVRYQDII
jgi:hypothetical protein